VNKTSNEAGAAKAVAIKSLIGQRPATGAPTAVDDKLMRTNCVARVGLRLHCGPAGASR